MSYAINLSNNNIIHKKNNLPAIIKYITSIPIVYSSIHLFCSNIVTIKIKNCNIPLWNKFIYDITQSLLITGNCILLENYTIANIENSYYSNTDFYYNEKKQTNYIHIKYAEILNEIWSTAPLESAMSTLNIYYNIDIYLQNLLRHGGRNSGLLFAAHSMGDDIKRRISSKITDFYKDLSFNSGALILDGNFNWQDIMISPDKMQINDIKNKIERQICSLFGIPPCLLGVIDTTYNNYELSLTHFINHSIIPLLTKIIEYINYFYQLDLEIIK